MGLVVHKQETYSLKQISTVKKLLEKANELGKSNEKLAILFNLVGINHDLSHITKEVWAKIAEFINEADNLKLITLQKLLLNSISDNRFGSIIDKIIAQTITKDNANLITFGVLNTQFISLKNIKLTSYIIDYSRWKVNTLNNLFSSKPLDNIILGDLDKTNPNQAYDVAYLSINKFIHYADYTTIEGISPISDGIMIEAPITIKQKEHELTLSAEFLNKMIPGTTAFYYHIFRMLELLSPDGRLFLSIRINISDMDNLTSLRKILIDNNFIESIIFINDEKQEGRLLLTLKKNRNTDKIYFITENFFSAYNTLSEDSKISKISEMLEEQSIVDGISGLASSYDLHQVNYRFNPRTLMLMPYKINPLVANNNYLQVELQSCCKIFRGCHLFTKSSEFQQPDGKSFILNQMALTEDGIDIDKLVAIDSQTFKKHEKYQTQFNDIVLLARSTQIKCFMIPDISYRLIANSNLYILRANDGFDPYYIYLLLNSDYGKKILESAERGAKNKSISINELKKLTIRIHASEVQSELAEKYRNALVNLQQAKQNLEQIIDSANLIF